MIRVAAADDADGYTAYLTRHIAESGRDGDPVYAVPADDEPFDPDGFARRVVTRWAMTTGSPGWQRTYVAVDDGTIVAHCELETDRAPFSRHRAELSLGVLRSHRRRGLGADLLDAALGWARTEPTVAWVDLGVFVPNPIALAVYERSGFERTGLVVDRYRTGGASLDELTMTLRVGDATP